MRQLAIKPIPGANGDIAPGRLSISIGAALLVIVALAYLAWQLWRLTNEEVSGEMHGKGRPIDPLSPQGSRSSWHEHCFGDAEGKAHGRTGVTPARVREERRLVRQGRRGKASEMNVR